MNNRQKKTEIVIEMVLVTIADDKSQDRAETTG